MPNYKILLTEHQSIEKLLNKPEKQYNAEICAENTFLAKMYIKDYYAESLDTTPDNIKILSIIKI